MSKPSSRVIAPLVLELTPSRWLRIFHLVALALAIAAIFLSALPWPLRGALLVSVLLGARWLDKPSPLRRLIFDGTWRGRLRDLDEQALQLDGAVVWPILIVLRFRAQPALVLLPDSVDPEDWRRLRLHLNHSDVFGDQRAL